MKTTYFDLFPNFENSFKYLWNEGLILAISVLFGYLLVGTIFYANYDQFGWKGGFEYAVSLGLVSFVFIAILYKLSYSKLFNIFVVLLINPFQIE